MLWGSKKTFPLSQPKLDFVHYNSLKILSDLVATILIIFLDFVPPKLA